MVLVLKLCLAMVVTLDFGRKKINILEGYVRNIPTKEQFHHIYSFGENF